MKSTKQMIITLSLVFASTLAHAEIKPAGAIVMGKCGNNTRGTRVCLAASQTKTFLVIEEFGQKPVYMAATAKRIGFNATGATLIAYTGFQVEFVNGYMMEREYTLSHSSDLAGFNLHGTLRVDGQILGTPSFPMEHMMVTQ